MQRFRFILFPMAVLILGVGLSGCQGLFSDGDSPSGQTTDAYYDDSYFEDINLSVNAEHGGYNMTDEEPAFGDSAFEDLFRDHDIINDNVENDVDVQGMEDDPSARIHYLRLTWGQLQGEPDFEEATNWSGSISVDKGALIIVRRIAFEHLTDWVVLPREDVKVIDLYSLTGPHFDGLLVKIIDPDPDAGEPNMLHIDMGPAQMDMEVALLDGYQEIIDVDELGNQMSLQAPVILDCLNGFLTGIWYSGPSPDRGGFRGGFVTYDGSLNGFVRGHWGINEEGENVFFGKYIAMDGEFIGILEGNWIRDIEAIRAGTGNLEGFWYDQNGETQGTLDGHYRRGYRRGGYFCGRWVEECGL